MHGDIVRTEAVGFVGGVLASFRGILRVLHAEATSARLLAARPSAPSQGVPRCEGAAAGLRHSRGPQEPFGFQLAGRDFAPPFPQGASGGTRNVKSRLDEVCHRVAGSLSKAPERDSYAYQWGTRVRGSHLLRMVTLCEGARGRADHERADAVSAC